MKQIPLLQGKTLLIELPEGAANPEVHTRSLTFDTPMEVDEWGYDYQSVKLPPGNWRIIGMLSEVSEWEAEQIVGFGDADPSGDRFVVGHRLFDKEQEEPFLFWEDVTALESLDSAILAEGYYLDENPIAVPDFSGGNIRFSETVEYAKAQSRVLDRSRCLLLGREI